jgi:hypothetical protein
MEQRRPRRGDPDGLELAEERIVDSVVEGTPQDQNIREFERYVGLVSGGACLITWRLFSRPFVIFQRQCQINRNALSSFSILAPFSTLGVMTTIATHHVRNPLIL